MQGITQLNDMLRHEISQPVKDHTSINYTLKNIAKAFNYQYKHNKNDFSDDLMAGLFQQLKETYDLFKTIAPFDKLQTNGNKYLKAFGNIRNLYDYRNFTIDDSFYPYF